LGTEVCCDIDLDSSNTGYVLNMFAYYSGHFCLTIVKTDYKLGRYGPDMKSKTDNKFDSCIAHTYIYRGITTVYCFTNRYRQS